MDDGEAGRVTFDDALFEALPRFGVRDDIASGRAFDFVRVLDAVAWAAFAFVGFFDFAGFAAEVVRRCRGALSLVVFATRGRGADVLSWESGAGGLRADPLMVFERLVERTEREADFAFSKSTIFACLPMDKPLAAFWFVYGVFNA